MFDIKIRNQSNGTTQDQVNNPFVSKSLREWLPKYITQAIKNIADERLREQEALNSDLMAKAKAAFKTLKNKQDYIVLIIFLDSKKQFTHYSYSGF